MGETPSEFDFNSDVAFLHFRLKQDNITYVPLPGGFMYLAAVIDWYSRYVITWRLSNTLDGSF